MPSLLILGGTRNLGRLVVEEFLAAGWSVTTVNRGVTADLLPAAVERRHADRSDRAAWRAVLARGTWDLVVDLTCYSARDAGEIAVLLGGRVGRYVFIGTGQVYLVHAGSPRPAAEVDAAGPLVPEPVAGTRDHANWTYGVEKWAAEEQLRAAWDRDRFPVTILRLPMIHSPYDHYERLANYFWRLTDGGPILVPEGNALPIRHVYALDIVRVLLQLGRSTAGIGGTFNLAHDETLFLEAALEVLAAIAGTPLRIRRVPRTILDTARLLPACSPFSDPWMSALDNTRARRELGFQPTPVRTAWHTLGETLLGDPRRAPPAGYAQRARELAVAV